MQEVLDGVGGNKCEEKERANDTQDDEQQPRTAQRSSASPSTTSVSSEQGMLLPVDAGIRADPNPQRVVSRVSQVFETKPPHPHPFSSEGSATSERANFDPSDSQPDSSGTQQSPSSVNLDGSISRRSSISSQTTTRPISPIGLTLQRSSDEALSSTSYNGSKSVRVRL